MNDCIFCKIINGAIPSHKIYEDEHTLAFLDISNDVEGHTLVIPKTHYKNLLDVDQLSLSHTINTVKKIASHYVSIGYDGVHTLNNNGAAADQSVNHLHFHIIPRKNADGIQFFAAQNPKEIDLSALKEKLKIKS